MVYNRIEIKGGDKGFVVRATCGFENKLYAFTTLREVITFIREFYEDPSLAEQSEDSEESHDSEFGIPDHLRDLEPDTFNEDSIKEDR